MSGAVEESLLLLLLQMNEKPASTKVKRVRSNLDFVEKMQIRTCGAGRPYHRRRKDPELPVTCSP